MELYYTLCEAAVILKLHEDTVRGHLIAGRLWGRKMPSPGGNGAWRIPERAIKCFLHSVEYTPSISSDD